MKNKKIITRAGSVFLGLAIVFTIGTLVQADAGTPASKNVQEKGSVSRTIVAMAEVPSSGVDTVLVRGEYDSSVK